MAENEKHSDSRHEPNAVSIRFVLNMAIGLIVLMALSMLVSGGLLSVLLRTAASPSRPRASLVEATDQRTKPGLDVDQRGQRREQREAEDKILNGYQWIDQREGLARIPVRRAMAILVHEGLPTRERSEPKE